MIECIDFLIPTPKIITFYLTLPCSQTALIRAIRVIRVLRGSDKRGSRFPTHLFLFLPHPSLYPNRSYPRNQCTPRTPWFRQPFLLPTALIRVIRVIRVLRGSDIPCFQTALIRVIGVIRVIRGSDKVRISIQVGRVS